MMTVAVMQQSRPLFLAINGDQVVCGVPVGLVRISAESSRHAI
jgi:hypothetical protein